MQAYDVKRKRIVNVEREENGVIIAYSLQNKPGIWYFPLIKNGKTWQKNYWNEAIDPLTGG